MLCDIENGALPKSDSLGKGVALERNPLVRESNNAGFSAYSMPATRREEDCFPGSPPEVETLECHCFQVKPQSSIGKEMASGL